MFGAAAIELSRSDLQRFPLTLTGDAARYNFGYMPSVEQVRWAKFRVTVTTLVALTILATLIILLTGGTLFQPQSEIYLFISDATGIVKGSPVRVDRSEEHTSE